MATIDIDFRKWPDSPHWHFQMYALGEDDFGRWFWAPTGTATQRGTEAPSEASSTWVKVIPHKGWWSAVFQSGSDLNLYIDVCTPAEWGDGWVKMIDLDLDVLRQRNSEKVVLDDEDEFLEHQRTLNYPQRVIDSARTSAADLMHRAEQRIEPFGEVGGTWLARAQALEATGKYPALARHERWESAGVAAAVGPGRPTVSVIIPARNGGVYLGAALDALMAQTYENITEIVIADGASTDDTLDIIRARSAQDDRIRVVENPGGTTPVGLNIALRATSGDVIVRCDAQTELPPTYVAEAVATLQRTGAGNVGGMQRAEGITTMQRTIAYAMTSRIGVGDAAFRYGGAEGSTDTVYLGVFDRKKLDAVGHYDETLIRNQDYELNARLRAAGHDVWFDPTLAVVYRPRTSLRGLAAQYWQYGAWKRHVVTSGKAPMRLRQLAPPALVVGFLGTGLLALSGSRVPFYALSAVYETAIYSGTALWLYKTRDKAALGFAAAVATMHFAWGAGFLVGRRQRPTDA
jgi:succinoglycan biosynthesis protein ExoA